MHFPSADVDGFSSHLRVFFIIIISPKYQGKREERAFLTTIPLIYTGGFTVCLLAMKETFYSGSQGARFQNICFPLEFIWRIIRVNGGKVKKNKITGSFTILFW